MCLAKIKPLSTSSLIRSAVHECIDVVYQIYTCLNLHALLHQCLSLIHLQCYCTFTVQSLTRSDQNIIKFKSRSETLSFSGHIRRLRWNVCILWRNLMNMVTWFPFSRSLRVTSVTDELGSRQRDQSTLSVTKPANGHWHSVFRIWLPHPAERV